MQRVFARSLFAATVLLGASAASAADLDGAYLRGDVGADGARPGTAPMSASWAR